MIFSNLMVSHKTDSNKKEAGDLPGRMLMTKWYFLLIWHTMPSIALGNNTAEFVMGYVTQDLTTYYWSLESRSLYKNDPCTRTFHPTLGQFLSKIPFINSTCNASWMQYFSVTPAEILHCSLHATVTYKN